MKFTSCLSWYSSLFPLKPQVIVWLKLWHSQIVQVNERAVLWWISAVGKGAVQVKLNITLQVRYCIESSLTSLCAFSTWKRLALRNLIRNASSVLCGTTSPRSASTRLIHVTVSINISNKKSMMMMIMIMMMMTMMVMVVVMMVVVMMMMMMMMMMMIVGY